MKLKKLRRCVRWLTEKLFTTVHTAGRSATESKPQAKPPSPQDLRALPFSVKQRFRSDVPGACIPGILGGRRAPCNLARQLARLVKCKTLPRSCFYSSDKTQSPDVVH